MVVNMKVDKVADMLNLDSRYLMNATDAVRVSENLESRRCEDAKMQSCGEGFRKSGESKMRRCKDAERVSENLESRRCEDVKMRRGLQKIWRAEDAKMRRCKDAERVSENLES